MDAHELIELVNLVCSKDIAEFEVEHEGFRLRIVKPTAVTATAVSAPIAPATVSVQNVAGANPGGAAESALEPDDDSVIVVNSPIVGTFYRAASPAAEPYVKVGDRVKKGQVLCIIEAMKLMNEIESEVSGVLVDAVAENGQPVEYGDPLFKVEPDR